MPSKHTNKRRRQTRVEWTVEPVRPVEREQLVEQIVLLLDAARRRILAPEGSIQ